MYGSDATLLGLFCRSDTLLLLAFMSVYNLKSSWYITTISDQLRELAAAGAFDDATAVAIADTFNVAFPLGAGLCSIGASALLVVWRARRRLHGRRPRPRQPPRPRRRHAARLDVQYWAALSFGPTRTLQWACYFHFLYAGRRATHRVLRPAARLRQPRDRAAVRRPAVPLAQVRKVGIVAVDAERPLPRRQRGAPAPPIGVRRPPRPARALAVAAAAPPRHALARRHAALRPAGERHHRGERRRRRRRAAAGRRVRRRSSRWRTPPSRRETRARATRR